MGLYLITYDLNRPGQDYSALFARIKECGNAWHGMQNTWFVDSKSSAKAIRDHFGPAIDAGDKLFVSRVQEAAWQGFTSEGDAWIKARAV